MVRGRGRVVRGRECGERKGEIAATFVYLPMNCSCTAETSKPELNLSTEISLRKTYQVQRPRVWYIPSLTFLCPFLAAAMRGVSPVK